MEITGKIIAVLEARGGTSARTGSPWKMQEYVLETINEQYPRRMCFNVFGEDKIASMNIQQNEIMTVYFDFNAREYQGRWYNDIRAWKVDRNVNVAPGTQFTTDGQAPFNNPAQPAQPQPTAQAPTQPTAPAFDNGGGNDSEDLPF
ncbi:MAG: DUF3127 domain-containing protein [Bacteroidaceae bacterium]|nr:DUF3127 domain-containing protein [Bacteroidaceae bacterium]